MTDFQSYANPPSADVTAPRVALLREALAAESATGFLVPRADEHQGEYVAPSSERLAWISGFTGSAGLAVILEGAAALFVDGRYTLQAQDQVDLDLFAVHQIPEAKPTDWMLSQLSSGDTLLYDPWLVTLRQVDRYEAALAKADVNLRPCSQNLIDQIWTDRPAPPIGPVRLHPIDYAGETVEAKLGRVYKAIEQAGADSLVITDPASLAWLFNIRGSDIAHNPIPLGFALISRAGSNQLFLDPRKLDDTVRGELSKVADLKSPEVFTKALENLDQDCRLLVDPDVTADAVRRCVMQTGTQLIQRPDPVADLKAVKNETEREGARQAHIRDGAAVVRFLSWLDTHAHNGGVDEIQASRQLEAFRRDTGLLKETSFDTISGAGPHGAIIHYRVTEATNAQLLPNSLYLVDSGGQYLDGTTDITRTIVIGEPTEEMKRAFTLVLKGLIAVSIARFPPGTTGAPLDTLARQALWSAGLDYDHGTGHGVGSYLCVHEGPARLSKTGTVALKPGMILSNEPGYYKKDEFGIRLETLVLVSEATSIEGGERDMMAFETLTLAPFDVRLVEIDLLQDHERDWLNSYHSRVNDTLSPLLDQETATWLRTVTQPI